jgi:hypothetical protein
VYGEVGDVFGSIARSRARACFLALLRCF